MITLQRWILAAIILFIGAVTPSVVAQNANVSLPAASAPAPQAVAPSAGCHNEQGLTYLCDLRDRKSTRLNSSHRIASRMPSSA